MFLKRTVSLYHFYSSTLIFSSDHQRFRRDISVFEDEKAVSPWTRVSRFLPTTRTIMQFAEGRTPAPNDIVVYVCGTFDLFHIGHLCFLEEARKLGDYLIVGIHSDQVLKFFLIHSVIWSERFVRVCIWRKIVDVNYYRDIDQSDVYNQLLLFPTLVKTKSRNKNWTAAK